MFACLFLLMDTFRFCSLSIISILSMALDWWELIARGKKNLGENDDLSVSQYIELEIGPHRYCTGCTLVSHNKMVETKWL